MLVVGHCISLLGKYEVFLSAWVSADPFLDKNKGY